MKNILIFGNPLVEQDSLAIKLIPKLKSIFPNINFIHLDPTENIENYGPDLTIIDVFVGIKKPIILNDLDKIKLPNVNSMHDFDLGYNLKLLKSVGKINNATIYGLPHNMKEDNAIKWLKKNISPSTKE